MTIRKRVFSCETDLPAMAVLAGRTATNNLHVADLPYRFSSWALDFPENVGLWVDEQGTLLGWAMMQTPFWTIDYVYDPSAAATLRPLLLRWADARARAIVETSSGRPIWFINVFTGQMERIQELEEAGFASQADVGENSWTKVLMRRPGRGGNQIEVDEPVLPEGFAIRPLAGDDEASAYVALHRDVFESKSMTVNWRRRTLARPEHIADLDLVAVAPDGRLAAFCIGWLNRGSAVATSGQIEPLGVHEDFRELGLGRAMLNEALRRLQQHGATSIVVETDNYRDEAFLLYESVGFEVVQDVLVYRKDYGNL